MIIHASSTLIVQFQGEKGNVNSRTTAFNYAHPATGWIGSAASTNDLLNITF